MLITFEGGEGAGKSTQAELLAKRLRDAGREAVVVREPGGTHLGEDLRRILMHDHSATSVEAEVLLFLAARAELVNAVIRPALEAGTVVICDRFADSTLAYQGYGRGVDANSIRTLNRWAGLLRPAPSVALLAPDGAGKSTLAAGVQNSFFFPVRSVYMGLYQKTTAQAARPGVRGMGFVRRLFTQWRRYLIARYHQARGRLVIFDRYTFDALLPPRHNLSGLGRLRRWLLAHACPPPDLVLMLDAPGEVLYARKGEHNADLLEQQRQQYLALRPHLPQMVVVNASRDAERVRREAMAVIWRICAAHFI